MSCVPCANRYKSNCVLIALSPDLDSVLMTLHQKINNNLWYTFGLELGVPVKLLESLKRYPQNECMVEVVDYWLRNHPNKPTWSELENAIKECCVVVNEGKIQLGNARTWLHL